MIFVTAFSEWTDIQKNFTKKLRQKQDNDSCSSK
ncbi:hypothetical protein I656_00298 [Geobacillus sp. WSUCF1]|nr:hypothetical protein I656_00298 [Geobacillus sp. WSUCF1]